MSNPKQWHCCSDHGTGEVTEGANAARAPALSAHASQIVPVQDHTDHTVLELLGHYVVKYDVQYSAHVHQEGGKGSPGAVLLAAVLQQQEHKADVERHKAHQDLHNQCYNDPDGLLLDIGFQLGCAPVDEVVHDNNVAAHHDEHGHQEEEGQASEVDRVVPPQVDYIVHPQAGGVVVDLVWIILKEKQRGCTAESHDPYASA